MGILDIFCPGSTSDGPTPAAKKRSNLQQAMSYLRNCNYVYAFRKLLEIPAGKKALAKVLKEKIRKEVGLSRS